MITAADNQDVPDYEISDPAVFEARPLVSVLMLAYNHEKYLAQAIEAVLSQDVDFPFELLIGEDGSTDKTRSIALRYQLAHPEVVRVITAATNVGIKRNWQRLASNGRGDFFAHLDGDDYWLPGKLGRQVAFLEKEVDCVAVFTAAITVDDAGNPLGLFNNVGDGKFDLPAMLRRGNFLNTSSMLFRSDSRHLLLDIDKSFIDYRVNLRLARHGLLAQIGETLTAYRVNASGSMTSKSNDLVRQLYWEAIMDVPREMVTPHDFALGLTDFLRRVLFRAIRESRWELLREWAPKVFRESPYGPTRTTLLVFSSAMQAATLEILGLLGAAHDGSAQHTLHRH